MHNIKDIRNDVEGFKAALKKRFIELDLDKIFILDENNRKYIKDFQKPFKSYLKVLDHLQNNLLNKSNEN